MNNFSTLMTSHGCWHSHSCDQQQYLCVMFYLYLFVVAVAQLLYSMNRTLGDLTPGFSKTHLQYGQLCNNTNQTQRKIRPALFMCCLSGTTTRHQVIQNAAAKLIIDQTKRTRQAASSSCSRKVQLWHSSRRVGEPNTFLPEQHKWGPQSVSPTVWVRNSPFKAGPHNRRNKLPNSFAVIFHLTAQLWLSLGLKLLPWRWHVTYWFKGRMRGLLSEHICSVGSYQNSEGDDDDQRVGIKLRARKVTKAYW